VEGVGEAGAGSADDAVFFGLSPPFTLGLSPPGSADDAVFFGLSPPFTPTLLLLFAQQPAKALPLKFKLSHG